MSARAELLEWLHRECRDATPRETGPGLEIELDPTAIPKLATGLVEAHACEFATLVVEQGAGTDEFSLYYVFYDADSASLIVLHTHANRDAELPAISDRVHAADWHEREIEDLYGLHFAGHPFLGDFVLHDSVWSEGVAPMRREFDARTSTTRPGNGAAWRPRRLLDEEGSIIFPVGPVWADYGEAGMWLLETPGEQIHEGQTRLFYKYRGVEKIAEGETPERALLLAERFSGSSAFAHASAFCQALEKIIGCNTPPRAQALRLVFAEFERIRYHVATIAELAGSTSLLVGKSMSQEIVEQVLRLTGQVCGHRYLFGLCAPGGLAREPGTDALATLGAGLARIMPAFAELERLLVHTSSFLDRIEEMGTLRPEVADLYGVVGPVARASGRRIDLRRSLPYGAYVEHPPAIAHEVEGDGYARLRVYFTEIRESAALIRSLLGNLPSGPISSPCPMSAGAALGWAEAPAGGAFHWLRIDERGRVGRLRIAPPGLRNWHVFHRALEGAAFQDFHIIMASFGLFVAESDR